MRSFGERSTMQFRRMCHALLFDAKNSEINAATRSEIRLLFCLVTRSYPAFFELNRASASDAYASAAAAACASAAFSDTSAAAAASSIAAAVARAVQGAAPQRRRPPSHTFCCSRCAVATKTATTTAASCEDKAQRGGRQQPVAQHAQWAVAREVNGGRPVIR